MPESAETQLQREMAARWAELDAFFMGRSKVHQAAANIARRLEELGVPYAIAGALSLGAHGFVRATEDVDVLVTREGLARFKQAWLGRGYQNLRPGGKAVRDTVEGVKIDFLIAGDYPGDKKPKPVASPDPDEAALPGKPPRVITLRHLVELKLASAMTAPHRGHDFFDIVHLAERGLVTTELRDQLDPYVRDKFDEALKLGAAAREDDY